jgi:hypothetical protein
VNSAPNVLIVGGFATVPPNYWRFRSRLLDRGAARVDIAPLWTPDWLLAGMLGFGMVMRRTGRAIADTYHAGGRRPIMVIAHSGGGIAARLAMSDKPYHARIASVAPAVGCLVTLGTPHGLTGLDNRYHHAGHEAAGFLEREQPGAYFAPRTAYLSVGSRQPNAFIGGPVGSIVDQVFSMIVGTHDEKVGDGIVPHAAVHLAGAEQITLDNVLHGMIGSPWYGDDAVMDGWWPDAVRLWQRALEARRAGAVSIGPGDPEVARQIDREVAARA